MSDFDIVPTGGDLAPLSPSAPLAPQPDSGWMVPTPDFLSENQSQISGGTPTIFGVATPGATFQQAEQAIGQIADVFTQDMAKLGLDSRPAKEAANWFKGNALLPLGYVSPTHNYDLRGYRIPDADRDAVTSFLNHMSAVNAPQKFVAACLWWINELGKQQSQPKSQSPSPSRSMTDAEWRRFEAKNNADIASADAALRQHWGNQYKHNMQIVADFYYSLPAKERERFENQVLENGVMAMSDPVTILYLFDQAIGGSLPSGAALAKEISDIENMMRTDRKAYIQNERLQARYRELITARDGG